MSYRFYAAFFDCSTSDGIGYDPSIKLDDGKSHIGIENIKQRLEYLFNGSLEITSVIGKGTIAIVHLPKRN